MLLISGMSDRIPLSGVADYARRVESLGYDILHVPETIHDSMTVSVLALQATTRLRVQTSLTLAFPRSPMLLALQSWDASVTSGGRFDLGLATQIRQNMEGRFGVSWSDPIARMSDYVTTVRTIWNAFSHGEPLDVRTASYTIDRLQPFFSPGPLPHDPPTILLGGVNHGAIRLAGRVADWFVTHPTNSHPRFVRELAAPALAEVERLPNEPTRHASSRPRRSSPVVTEPRSRRAERVSAASWRFFIRLPAYQRSLEMFGWPELGGRLRAMTRSGDWSGLGSLMSDEVLDTILPTASWNELSGVLGDWYAGLVDGLLIQPPNDAALDDEFRSVLAAIGGITPRQAPDAKSST